MNSYPFDPQLLADLTALYNDFVKNATKIIKTSKNIDFTKVIIDDNKVSKMLTKEKDAAESIIKREARRKKHFTEAGYSEIPLDSPGHFEDPAYMEVPNADDAFHRFELREVLNHAISQLPKNQQFVIRKVVIEDMPANEVAKIMGVGKSRISNLKKLALDNLRNRLNPHELFC